MKYAFCGGKLLDGTREMQPREGLVLRTDGDRITDIVPEGTDLTGYEVVDLKGGYLMPGLINMHVHLAGSGKPQKKQRDNEKLVKTILSTGLTRKVAYGMVAGFAKDELFSGVTTIRTVGGLADFDTRLRDDIRAGRRVGPRILAANEGISVPGGHMAGSLAYEARSAQEAADYVRRSGGPYHRRGTGPVGEGAAAGRGSGETDDHRRCAGRQGEGRAGRAEDAAGDGEGGVREGS